LPSARLVTAAAAEYAVKGELYAAVATLASASGYDERTVRQGLAALENDGWLERLAEGRGRPATRYRLRLPDWVTLLREVRPSTWRQVLRDGASAIEEALAETGQSARFSSDGNRVETGRKPGVTPDEEKKSVREPLRNPPRAENTPRARARASGRAHAGNCDGDELAEVWERLQRKTGGELS
jgi:hypothetical protein